MAKQNQRPTQFDRPEQIPPWPAQHQSPFSIIADTMRLWRALTQNITRRTAMRLKLKRFEIIDDVMADILRRKTDAQRLRSVDAFWNSARAILKAAIRTEHPEWNLHQVNVEVARRIGQGASGHAQA